MAANLREDAFSGTDHRLLKPFFDFRTNQDQATSQSYFIEAVLLGNFERSPAPGLSENQKMVLVNGDQYPKMHLPSNLQPNLSFCDHPNEQQALHLEAIFMAIFVLILRVCLRVSVSESQNLLAIFMVKATRPLLVNLKAIQSLYPNKCYKSPIQ